MVQCWSIPFAREGSKWAIEISILLWWPRAVSLYSQGWGDSVPVRIAISCSLPCSIDWFEISEQIFLKALYIVITTFYLCFSLIVRSKHRAFIWWFRNYNRSGYCRPSMWFHHVSQTPGEGGYTIAVNYCKSICILLLSSVSLQLVNYFFFLLALLLLICYLCIYFVGYDMQFDIKYAYFNFLQSVSYESSSLSPILSWREDEDSESGDGEVWRIETTFFFLISSFTSHSKSLEIWTLHLENLRIENCLNVVYLILAMSFGSFSTIPWVFFFVSEKFFRTMESYESS